MTARVPLLPIAYRDGDAALRGELALPAGSGPHPGVLLLHGGTGLNDELRAHAARLAEEGYAAFVADTYAVQGRAITPAEGGQHMLALQADSDLIRARNAAALAAFVAHPSVDAKRIAAIGFCFGGQCALELARSGADLKATISFHGVLKTRRPAANGAIRGQVAIFTGARDPLAPPEDVEALRGEMTAAGAAWQVTVYGEGWHAFASVEPAHHDWIRHDPLLERLSWASAGALLDATLHPRHSATTQSSRLKSAA